MKKIALAALACLAVNSAYAYVPPSGFMVRTMVSKRRALKTIRIKSVVIAESSQVRFKQTTSYDSKTGLLRSVSKDDLGNDLYVAERPLQKTPLASRVLMETDTGVMITALKAAQIPVVSERELLALPEEHDRRNAEATMFGRTAKTKFAWIIGKADTPQLWLEKDAFYPLKLVFPSESLEIRFESFRFNHDVPFPRLISVFKKDQQVVREELGEVSVDVSLPEMKTPAATGFTDAGNSAESNVRELIRQYYEWIR